MIAEVLPTTNQTTEPTDERFVLDSEEKVNWVLRKMANLEAERVRVQHQAQAMLLAIDSDLTRLHRRFDDDLKAFAAQKLAEAGNRRKSVLLLQGTLAFRTVGQRVKVTDEVAAFAYAHENGFGTKIVLDAAAYHDQAEAHLQETGELLPGLEVKPEREAFRITFGKSQEA